MNARAPEWRYSSTESGPLQPKVVPATFWNDGSLNNSQCEDKSDAAISAVRRYNMPYDAALRILLWKLCESYLQCR